MKQDNTLKEETALTRKVLIEKREIFYGISSTSSYDIIFALKKCTVEDCFYCVYSFMVGVNFINYMGEDFLCSKNAFRLHKLTNEEENMYEMLYVNYENGDKLNIKPEGSV